ncbi:MAG: ribonuclease P protein component 1 [Nanoarchaeota archaeon]|nr:ribonuclease P protein component 1 [Nanoarchaeota archaeon]|tara:strand:+ start:73 stop:330 length:258 start_codon:yes stop_codon:yes gene_type:complete
MGIKDVVKYEFIGEKLKVIEAKNKNLIGVTGKVINETKNMFVLNNEKKLIKNQCVFDIHNGEKVYRIDGKLLVGRPEDRIKKRIK